MSAMIANTSGRFASSLITSRNRATPVRNSPPLLTGKRLLEQPIGTLPAPLLKGAWQTVFLGQGPLGFDRRGHDVGNVNPSRLTGNLMPTAIANRHA